jgi:hypothetical protein
MTSRPSRRLWIVASLALVLFGLFLTSPQVLHAHGAGGLGFYSAECPLADIAARHGQASLPTLPLVVATWWTLGHVPAVAAIYVPTPLVRSTDSRAPPLA